MTRDMSSPEERRKTDRLYMLLQAGVLLIVGTIFLVMRSGGI